MTKHDAASNLPDTPWVADQLDWPVTTVVGPGLAGAIACGTHVAARNPQTGVVTLRGVPVAQLGPTRTFEEVACLLVCGELPAGGDRHDEDDDAAAGDWVGFRETLRAARELPDGVADVMRSPSLDVLPLRLLRAGMSAMGSRLGKEPDQTLSAGLAAALIGEYAGLLMLLAAHRAHLREPEATLPGVSSETGLDAGLVLALGAGSGKRIQKIAEVLPWLCTMVADDGLDAATFAGLVVGSCQADPWSAVVATLSAFEGAVRQPQEEQAPADQRLEMLRHRLSATAVNGVDAALDRAVALDLIDARAKAAPSILSLAVALLLEHGLDADPPMIPAVLALPRVVAMVARLAEFQQREPRLFRPFARYVGPAERRIEG